MLAGGCAATGSDILSVRPNLFPFEPAPAGRVRPMAHAAAAHRARLHQRPETGVVGHKERRTTDVGCEGVRSFYQVRSEYSVSTESSPFYDCCLGTLD